MGVGNLNSKKKKLRLLQRKKAVGQFTFLGTEALDDASLWI
jgi:hypothetical protein